jgi:hypothetical protein
MPTGLGEYSISAWAMQSDGWPDMTIDLAAQIALTCAQTSSYVTVQMSGVGLSASPGTWVQLAGDVNTKMFAGVGSDCFADGPVPGAVKSALVWVNSPPALNNNANIYVDDLVIQSSDGHNLIGNPNFEAGTTAGWSIAGGTSTLGVSGMFAHGGQNSLWQTDRTLTTSAITYALPLGAARYAVSLWVLQNGTTGHQLALLPLYSCIGSSAGYYGTPSTPVVAAAGRWTQVTGTFVLPPPDAPAGCALSQASIALGQAETGTCGSTAECPDLFVDDASITLK